MLLLMNVYPKTMPDIPNINSASLPCAVSYSIITIISSTKSFVSYACII